MKRITALFTAALMGISLLHADEGMWLPALIKGYNHEQMVKMGLKLSPEQIYDVNHSSLKDAIAWFNGGCTSEIISAEGLLLTNHHCGYGAIQSHSTDNNNILKYGFWAKNHKEELANPNMSVSILVRMEDVTEQVMAALKDVPADKVNAKIAEITKPMVEKAKKEGVGYDAFVRDMYRGNQFYLFIFEKFTDVRLVAAPPESIGKFGGDTDNWMWPRHTGDFSMFRIYANKDNKPAPYSPDNQPYKPRHFLPVSNKGIKDGDFAMVYGFPGRTNRYETSFGVKLAIEESNPAVVKIRTKRLELMKEQMDADSSVDLQLSSRYAQIANYWKYYIGQTEQLKRLKVYDKKLQEEVQFQKWASDKTEYTNVLNKMKSATEAYRPYNLYGIYLNEGIRASSVVSMASLFISYEKAVTDTAAKRKGTDTTEIRKTLESLKSLAPGGYKLYNRASDRKIFSEMLWMFYTDIPKEQHPPIMKSIMKKGIREEAEKFADKVFAKSMFADSVKVNAFLKKPNLGKLMKDPAYVYIKSFVDHFNDKYLQFAKDYAAVMMPQGKIYLKAILEMNAGKVMYPDANSTLRLTYGTVKSYDPRDAVHYDYKTTLSGVMDKEQPGDDEFEVPAKLKELYRNKNFGNYAENGDVPVGFITTNDITGGNSGSPVINGNGELIGLAFDGNWEAMAGDIAFDPKFKRTINVDIRYVLFIIEKYGDAKNLINEMKIVN